MAKSRPQAQRMQRQGLRKQRTLQLNGDTSAPKHADKGCRCSVPCNCRGTAGAAHPELQLAQRAEGKRRTHQHSHHKSATRAASSTPRPRMQRKLQRLTSNLPNAGAAQQRAPPRSDVSGKPTAAPQLALPQLAAPNNT
eukprot:7494552-Alexandrium_andersonii.AAC.1